MHESIAVSASNVKVLHSSHRFSTTPVWWSEVCRSKAAYYILTLLASFDNPKRGCFPSIRRLADAAGCKKRVVQYHLKYLEGLGLIRRQRGRNIVFFEINYRPPDEFESATGLHPQVQLDCTFESATGLHLHTIEHTTRNSTTNMPAAAAEPGREGNMGRLKGVTNIRRIAPASKGERRPRRPADPNVAALMNRFQAQMFVTVDDDYPTREAAKQLLRIYGTVDEVMKAAGRAKMIEARICRDGSRLTLGSILFYARRYDKTRDAATLAQQDDERVKGSLDYAIRTESRPYFNDLIAMYSVSREQVSEWFGDIGLGMFDSESDSNAS